MKWCETCGTQSPDDAKFCSECGATAFRPVETAPLPDPPAEPEPAKAKTRMPLVLGMLLVAAVVVGAGAAWRSSRETPSEKAVAACKADVLDKLKNPASAEFANIEPGKDDSHGKAFIVSGDVDATNGFGAQVRTGWVCVAGDTDGKWSGLAVLDDDD